MFAAQLATAQEKLQQMAELEAQLAAGKITPRQLAHYRALDRNAVPTPAQTRAAVREAVVRKRAEMKRKLEEIDQQHDEKLNKHKEKR